MPNKVIPCPDCGTKMLCTEKTLQMHKDICKGRPDAPAPAAPTPALVTQPASVPQPVPVKPVYPDGIEVPALDDTFKVSHEHQMVMHVKNEMSRKGGIENLRVVGPSGLGKSSLAYYFAAMYDRPFLDWQCQLVTEPEDWWGSRELDIAKGTFAHESLLVKAMETPRAVVLLDEVNRAHPVVLNSLLGLLDHRHRQWVGMLKRYVTVAPGVTFILTMNEGAEMTGINELDKAFSDRVPDTLRVKYPQPSVEREILIARTGCSLDTAEHLVRFAGIVRGNDRLNVDASTRILLAAAKNIVGRLPLKDAVILSCIDSIPEESDRTTCLQALQQASPVSTGGTP